MDWEKGTEIKVEGTVPLELELCMEWMAANAAREADPEKAADADGAMMKRMLDVAAEQGWSREAAWLVEKPSAGPVVRTVNVNLFAGPGAGKTVAAHAITAELKRRGFEAEYVPEVAKSYIWKGDLGMLDGSLENQSMLYAEQLAAMEVLQGKVDFAVTDSPTLLSAQYLAEPDEAFSRRALEDFNGFRNFNVFIKRGSDYSERGRIHTAEQAVEIDSRLKEMLDGYAIYYGTYSRDDAASLAVDNMVRTFRRFNS